MSFRQLTVIIGLVLPTSSCLAQGIFLGKGENAQFVDFGFSTVEESYLIGLSGGFSAAGIFDFGLGGLYGGAHDDNVVGVSQFASIHLLRLDFLERSRFSLSFMQSLVSVDALGNSYYGGTTTLSIGGRATLQAGGSNTAVAPFLGYARAGVASESDEIDVCEIGLSIVTYSRRSVFVVTPVIGVASENTSFSLSFTLNFVGSGGGKWKDEFGN
jgi:hypothetical protein